MNCTACGAAIALHAPGVAEIVGCGACGSILDARTPGHPVLQRNEIPRKLLPAEIPIGRTGHLDGKDWTVIGHQWRQITVDHSRYEWREHLLWNREAGFRYLAEFDGHWNDIAVIHELPKEMKWARRGVALNGQSFRHFQSAVAVTRWVVGEFPWKVLVGDEVAYDDYVNPPLMLTREHTENEVIWSRGTYTSPGAIAKAFKVDSKLRIRRRTFANQPNPLGAAMAPAYLAFLGVLFVLFIARLLTADSRRVVDTAFRLEAGRAETTVVVTPSFEVGGPSNLVIDIRTDLDNDEAYFHLAVLPDSGGNGYEVGQAIGYYYGFDSTSRNADMRGPWWEGSRRAKLTLPTVAAGRYFLRVEAEHLASKTVSYQVTATSDVPRFWPFVAAFLVLSAVPFFSFSQRGEFEEERWDESDHAPPRQLEYE